MFAENRDTFSPLPNPEFTEEWLGNRFQRRHNKGLTTIRQTPFLSSLSKMADSINHTNSQWQEVVAGNDFDLSRIIYQGKPFIISWLEVRRRLPSFLDNAHNVNLQAKFTDPSWLSRFDSHDIYSRKVGGVRFLGIELSKGISFFDIEQMPMIVGESGERLLKEDIKKINRLFRRGEDIDKQPVREASVFFGIQPIVRDKEVFVPDSLKPLHERIIAYFKHYEDLLLNPNLSFWDEQHFLYSLDWSRPWLPQALGMFIPASLGITPSSAIELYRTRGKRFWQEELAFQRKIGSFLWEANILPSMQVGAKEAIRSNALPDKLRMYQYYDSGASAEAEKMILDHYNLLEISSRDQVEIYKRYQKVMIELSDDYFQNLQLDIKRAPGRFLEVDTGDQSLLDKVLLTSQNQRVLIFVVVLKGGKAHLTLEIDKSKNLYGLSPKIAIDYPNLGNRIVLDILSPVLEDFRKRHEALKPVLLSRQQTPGNVILEKDPTTTIGDVHKEQLKPLKTKRLLSPIVRYLEGPEPANVVPVELPKNVVFYSKEQIRKSTGNISEETLKRIVRGITDFEYRRGDYKKMREDIAEGEDLWEIRIPGYRVLVSHIDGDFYTFFKAGKRSEIFNIRRI